MGPTIRILMNMGTLHRLLPLWIAGLIAIVLFWTPWFLLAILYGMVAQFVVEYAMHRFLYHREPPSEQSPFNELYRSHIGHHEFPNNPEFFTGDQHWYPVKFASQSLVVHFLVLWYFLGWQMALLWPFIALTVGSVTAFTFYEYCHTLAHVKVPKGWFGERVTRSHLRHHFNDHETTFHVSFGMGWIDRLFGTAYDREQAKERFDRQTILSMGMDPDDLRLVTARKAYGLTGHPIRRKEA